ncbi:MAG: DUF839 domain-containing protein, partial [Haliea sp.]
MSHHHTITDSAPTFIDPDDLDNNSSGNTALEQVIAARTSRRGILRGGVGALAAASLGSLAACGGGGGGDDDNTPAPPAPVAPVLGFTAIGKSLADALRLPAGYTANVIYATGDSIDPAVSDYKNDGTDADFDRRSGDHHDGMHYFGLSADGKPAPTSNDRGLICINHEAINGTAAFLHPNGQTNLTTGPRPEAEALKEVEAHGGAVFEIARTSGKLGVVKSSDFNRRITPRTFMSFTGPARGDDLLKTKFSTDGTLTRGMIGNCASGYTPWGTYLTCEENFAGFFRRAAEEAG